MTLDGAVQYGQNRAADAMSKIAIVDALRKIATACSTFRYTGYRGSDRPDPWPGDANLTNGSQNSRR
jgi:hypothetical protein